MVNTKYSHKIIFATIFACILLVFVFIVTANNSVYGSQVMSGVCEHDDTEWYSMIIHEELWSITPSIENVWFPVDHTVLCPSYLYVENNS